MMGKLLEILSEVNTMSKEDLNNDILITKQKSVAKKVFSMLNKVDIGCILAGGAPREWWFGKPCNDLDFYFTVAESRQSFTEKQLKLVGFDNLSFNEKRNENHLYSTMKGLKRIWNTEVDGVKVQLIQMETLKHRYNVVQEMDVSICKIWCKEDLQPRLTNEFKKTVLTGVLMVKEGCENSSHLDKIKKYFPEYCVGTEETADRKLISKILRFV